MISIIPSTMPILFISIILLIATVLNSVPITHASTQHIQASQMIVDDLVLEPIEHVTFVNHVNHHRLRLRKRSHSDQDSSEKANKDHALQLQFQAYNQTFLLDLEQNKLFQHPNAKVVVYGDNGKVVQEQPLAANAYVGKVYSHRGYSSGWAGIIVHDDVNELPDNPHYEGTFQYDGTTYNIRTIDTYMRTKRDIDASVESDAPHTGQKMIIFKSSNNDQHSHSHSSPSPPSPSRDSAEYDVNRMFKNPYGGNDYVGIVEADAELPPKEQSTHDHHKTKRSEIPRVRMCGVDENFINITDTLYKASSLQRLSKRAPAGCPGTLKVLYMAVASDCTYTLAYGGPEGALKQIINNINTASAVYAKTFNIALGLIKVDIRTSCDSNPAWNRVCSDDYRINNRLSDFSSWRGSNSNDGAGLWHLMTQCSSGASVGVAWVAQACNTGASRQDGAFVSGTGVSSIGREEWKVVAHEIGHNFGAVHDCVDSLCAAGGASNGACCPCAASCDCRGQYLMHPTDNAATDTFSPCSINSICTVMRSAVCLQEPGAQQTIDANRCGNGIKEPGEECDCGTQCDSDSCCTKECKLKPGASCADINDPCCSQCKIKPAGGICRVSRSICDFEEKCDGVSPSCPNDNFQADGSSCGSNLQCANGYCTSREAQCKERGGQLPITGACKSETVSCDMTCTLSNGGCVALSGYFIDGTTCGYQSFCRRGECVSPNIFARIITLIMKNVAVAIVVIIIIVAVLGTCCFYGCRYARNRIRMRNMKKSGANPNVVNSNANNLTPEQQQQQQQQQQMQQQQMQYGGQYIPNTPMLESQGGFAYPGDYPPYPASPQQGIYYAGPAVPMAMPNPDRSFPSQQQQQHMEQMQQQQMQHQYMQQQQQQPIDPALAAYNGIHDVNEIIYIDGVPFTYAQLVGTDTLPPTQQTNELPPVPPAYSSQSLPTVTLPAPEPIQMPAVAHHEGADGTRHSSEIQRVHSLVESSSTNPFLGYATPPQEMMSRANSSDLLNTMPTVSPSTSSYDYLGVRVPQSQNSLMSGTMFENAMVSPDGGSGSSGNATQNTADGDGSQKKGSPLKNEL